MLITDRKKERGRVLITDRTERERVLITDRKKERGRVLITDRQEESTDYRRGK